MTSRRSDSLPRRFARLYTAAITDVMDEMGLLRQTFPTDIGPVEATMRMAGYAFTARGRPYRGTARDRDQTLRRYLGMIGAVPADSVLVLAANDSVAAHFGELSAEWFRIRKVRGAVIDGATRDFAPIARLGFPTFVRYRTPQDSVPRWRVTTGGSPSPSVACASPSATWWSPIAMAPSSCPGASPTRLCSAAKGSWASRTLCARPSGAA
jgi:regulator of RNase E activity RraA